MWKRDLQGGGRSDRSRKEKVGDESRQNTLNTSMALPKNKFNLWKWKPSILFLKHHTDSHFWDEYEGQHWCVCYANLYVWFRELFVLVIYMPSGVAMFPFGFCKWCHEAVCELKDIFHWKYWEEIENKLTTVGNGYRWQHQPAASPECWNNASLTSPVVAFLPIANHADSWLLALLLQLLKLIFVAIFFSRILKLILNL